MKRSLMTLAALTMLLLPWGGLDPTADRAEGAQPKDVDKASVWMKAKLKFSQEILDGLTRADFNKVRVNAETLALAGYLEKWSRAEDLAEYRRQMAMFEFANEELVRQANAKNVEGATLAYNQLTISCVQCHRVVRDTKK